MPDSLFQLDAPFLPWLPGETLFSLCSRHRKLWGHGLSANATELLFGGRRVGIHHDLPSALDQFELRTEGRFGSALQLARERTLLRYYRPFLSQGDVEHAAHAMRGASVAHLKLRIGILTSRFRANHPLKACPECLDADLDQHGWLYWHLVHQFPGVWICPTHGSPLLPSRIKSTGVERFLWHLPDRSALDHSWLDRLNGEVAGLARLTAFARELVEHDAPDGWLQLATVQKMLTTRLREKGWMTEAGHIRLKVAAPAYLEHCLPFRRVPEMAALPSDLAEAERQLGGVFRTARGGTHPIRLLVAISWLYESAAEFASISLNRKQAPRESLSGNLVPTGHDLGRVDDDVRAAVLDLMRSGASATSAAHQFQVDVGTAMAWAASTGIEVSRRPKLLRGAVREHLSAELARGRDKKEVATQFGISVDSVTRLLRTEIGLHDAWTRSRLARAQQRARREWLDAIGGNRGVGIKLLRQIVPAAYAWLYRNDRAWLKDHGPEECRQAPTARAPAVRWDDRDADLSQQVRAAGLALGEKAPSVAIRLWQICQAVPALKAKLSALDRLPLTRRAIEVLLGPRANSGSRGLFD